MKLEQQIISIVNKSKDGITLKVPGGKSQKMSWDEFNQNFVMTDDKKHCHCTAEFAKKKEEIDELIVSIIVAQKFVEAEQRTAKSNGGHYSNPGFYLTQLSTIGEGMQKLQKLLGCSMMEAARIIRNQMDQAFGENSFKPRKETPEEYRERKRQQAKEAQRRKEEMDPHRTYKPSATSTMADVPGMDKLILTFNK
ncbi:MAG: hypothetical protein [Wendovervirus sonii]|uniref:Uncharacterized protein n=1 Tax=phage Lak_Megaphage_Sonny TaxID=3109229 RepID=A0ABZ0Z665_9CAUD|nr:MAG: hypothetical protein [phage Lak_Megaphage_Sonny]